MSISSILNITSDRNDNGNELVFSDDDPEYLMEIDALIRHTLNTTTITTVSASLQPDKSKTIFKCKVPRCEKVFNSLGYLNKHQCLKHPENDT
ncbi:12909_t:CDS:2 [Entrophospora sp. SA101]|nr:12909_t:CDS:2 [Entrophospora sp. SA101]